MNIKYKNNNTKKMLKGLLKTKYKLTNNHDK